MDVGESVRYLTVGMLCALDPVQMGDFGENQTEDDGIRQEKPFEVNKTIIMHDIGQQPEQVPRFSTRLDLRQL